MCFKPIKILNPSRSYRSDVPKYLYVPCGHCQDCQRVKHNEWFFRAMIEWNYYSSIGGAVYFITLTYNENEVPKHTLSSGETIMCFDKRHIHNFIKYLRIYLARRHLEYKDIKYLICSEYSDQNTKRPHYHGLLFFPYHVPCVGEKSLFTRLMQTCWQHGWIVCSKFGWQIQSAKGIRYSTKYVCKDIGYYNEFVRDYLDCLDVEERKKRYAELSPFLPRHWQSIGFGTPFLDVIRNQKNISEYLFRDSYHLNIDRSSDFKIPRYYHLKFEKSVAKDLSQLLDKVVQVSTPLGKEVRLLRLKKMLDTSVIHLRDMLSENFLESDFPNELVYKTALGWYRKTYPLENITGKLIFKSYALARSVTIEYIKRHLCEFDLHRFASYQIFLRHLPIFDDEFSEEKFNDVDDVMHRMVDSPCVPPEIASLGLCSDADFIATPLKESEVALKQKMCCNDAFFLPYERLARALDDYTSLKNMCRDYNAWKKQDDKRRIKASKENKPKKYKSYGSF